MRDGVNQPLMQLKQAMRAAACNVNRRRLSSLASRVEKKLSATAVS